MQLLKAFRISVCLVGLAVPFVYAGSAGAASQGAIAGVSSATAQIGVVIPVSLHLSGGVGAAVALSAGTGHHPLCLSGRGVSAYAFRAVGSSGEGLVVSGDKGQVGYSATIHTERAGAFPLTAGRSSQPIELPDRDGCEPMLLSLKLLEAGATDDQLAGTLTVVVAPE